jgi:hypothetical protein
VTDKYQALVLAQSTGNHFFELLDINGLAPIQIWQAQLF